MQSRAVSVLITACFVASAQGVGAQIIYPSGSIPSRFSFGGDIVISQPKGEFANNVPTGYGFDLTGMFRIDPRGYLNIRADLGGVQYGRLVPALRQCSVRPDVFLDGVIDFGNRQLGQFRQHYEPGRLVPRLGVWGRLDDSIRKIIGSSQSRSEVLLRW